MTFAVLVLLKIVLEQCDFVSVTDNGKASLYTTRPYNCIMDYKLASESMYGTSQNKVLIPYS